MIPTPAPMSQNEAITAASQNTIATIIWMATRSSLIARTRACSARR
jgi:hypothetical protein